MFRASRLFMSVTKEIVRAGSGVEARTGDRITVHTTGYLKDSGNKFWSSRDDGRPFSFTLGIGQVIVGWDDGMKGMKRGEKARLTVTSNFAYGKKGFGAWGIPPDADLIFDVEVLDLK
jgi:peptidylprolyl isomerase